MKKILTLNSKINYNGREMTVILIRKGSVELMDARGSISVDFKDIERVIFGE